MTQPPMTPPTRNPFAPPTDAGQPGVRSSGAGPQVERVERIGKPWGHEEIVAVLEGSYVGKVLHISAGGVLSLQQHTDKDETLAVQSGRISIEHGADRDHLRRSVLEPGDRLLLRAGTVHRVTADVASVVLETATARPGWRQDVVRFDDRYGRVGTSAP